MAVIDNLIAYYSLDEASGNAIDAHSTHDLTETSGTIASTTGKVGNARDFEAGDTEYFTTPDSVDLSTGNIDFAVACWIMLESEPGAMNPVAKNLATGNQREWQLLYDSGTDRLIFRVSNDGTNVVSVSASNLGAVATATWYFVVMWHDAAANTINIQVNNGTANSQGHSTGVFNSSAAFTIGASDGPVNHFDGLVDEVGFWKKVLTADEKTFLYNAGSGRSYADIVAEAGGGAFTLTADAGSYALSGQAAGVLTARKLAAAAGSYAISGTDAALKSARLLSAVAGSYSVTGQDATLQLVRKLIAESGGYNISGQTAALLKASVLAAAPGSYAITGQDTTLQLIRKLIAESGGYNLSGQDAALKAARIFVVDAGSYSITGTDAVLTKIGDFVLIADSGAYNVNGQAALLKGARIFHADAGSYTISGVAADLRKGFVLVADAGVYAVTGQTAALLAARILSAQAGSYQISGQTASLKKSVILIAGAGEYLVTGAAAQLLLERMLLAESGVYTLDGDDAALFRNARLTAQAGAYVVTGTAATLTVEGVSEPGYVFTHIAFDRVETRIVIPRVLTDIRGID